MVQRSVLVEEEKNKETGDMKHDCTTRSPGKVMFVTPGSNVDAGR